MASISPSASLRIRKAATPTVRTASPSSKSRSTGVEAAARRTLHRALPSHPDLIPTADPGSAERTAPRLPLQCKLLVADSSSPLEAEADAAAEKALGPVEGRSKSWVRRADAPRLSEAPEAVHQVLRSPGQELDRATRSWAEDAFQRDFRPVRIHTGEEAEASAASIHARAYTVGSQIVLGAGAAPGSAGYRPVLAHELAHVVQQGHAPQHAIGSPAEPSAQPRSTAPAAIVQRQEAEPEDTTAQDLGWITEGVVEAAALPARALGDTAYSLVHATWHGFFAELKSHGGEAASKVLGRVREFVTSPKDLLLFFPKYWWGLIKGVVSPITGLFDLGKLGVQLVQIGSTAAGTAWENRDKIAADAKGLANSMRGLGSRAYAALKSLFSDPVGTVSALIPLLDQAKAETNAAAERGGHKIANVLLAAADQPIPDLAETAGETIGTVVVNVVLFVFTDGIGDAIVQIAGKLGEVGAWLGRLGKTAEMLGQLVAKLGELLTTVGGWVSKGEALIGKLAGALLKPLEPVLEEFGELVGQLRTFLRDLLGVAEKAETQEAAAAAKTIAGARGEPHAPKLSSGEPHPPPRAAHKPPAEHPAPAAPESQATPHPTEPVKAAPQPQSEPQPASVQEASQSVAKPAPEAPAPVQPPAAESPVPAPPAKAPEPAATPAKPEPVEAAVAEPQPAAEATAEAEAPAHTAEQAAPANEAGPTQKPEPGSEAADEPTPEPAPQPAAEAEKPSAPAEESAQEPAEPKTSRKKRTEKPPLDSKRQVQAANQLRQEQAAGVHATQEYMRSGEKIVELEKQIPGLVEDVQAAPAPASLLKEQRELRQIKDFGEKLEHLEEIRASRSDWTDAERKYLDTREKLWNAQMERQSAQEDLAAARSQRVDAEIKVPEAEKELRRASKRIANILRKNGPNYKAASKIKFDELLGEDAWKALEKRPRLDTDHIVPVREIEDLLNQSKLPRLHSQASRGVKEEMEKAMQELGDVESNLMRMRRDANQMMKSDRSWNDISYSEASKYGYTQEMVEKMRTTENAQRALIRDKIRSLEETFAGRLGGS